MPLKDKESRREYHRQYMRDYYKRIKKTHMVRVAKNQAELVEWFKGLKATMCCCRCGESHPACLDFHHRDPATKEFDVSIATNRGFGRPRIKAEIAKCDVLCSNCHRKLHWDERNTKKAS